MDKVHIIERMLKELPIRTDIQSIVVLNSRSTTNKSHKSTPPTTPDMVCDKSEFGPHACATQKLGMPTSGNVVGNSDLVNGVLSTNYQLTEMRQDNTVVPDPASGAPDSSMDSIIIPETQLDPMIEPRSIPESQLGISISDYYPALIQNGNITSTPERSASPVSRTVTPLVRPVNSHVTVDSPMLLSHIVGSQKFSASNGHGFTVVKRKKQRQSMVVGTNKNSSISSNKKCHLFVTRVSANIEDDSVLQYIKMQPLVSNCKLINMSKKGSKNKSFHAIIETDCIDIVLNQDFWPTGIAVRRYFLKH